MLNAFQSHIRHNVVGYIALFVALGGTTYAATGGKFILGQPNSASSTTSLSAGTTGPAFKVTNTSTGTGASLNVASGHPPFTVNSGTKVANLNADKLDGKNSTGFLANGSSAGGSLTGTYPNPTIAPNAVGTAEVPDNSLTGADIDESSLDAASLDTAQTLWAVVNSDGTLAPNYRNFGAVSSSRLAMGEYEVIFRQQIDQKCAIVATLGLSGPEPFPPNPGQVGVAPNTFNPDGVSVYTTDSAGTNADGGFHIAALC